MLRYGMVWYGMEICNARLLQIRPKLALRVCSAARQQEHDRLKNGQGYIPTTNHFKVKKGKMLVTL